MAIMVIGGQSSDVGKTSVVCGLISAMPERCWTAIKITQCKHTNSSSEPCDCELAGRTVAISEERDAASGTDTARYLAAGAARSLWVRTLPGHLGEAMPSIRAEIAGSTNIIIESNSILHYLEPDLYAIVLDPAVADFKPSAAQFLDRADALLMPRGSTQSPSWPGISSELFARIPAFVIPPSCDAPEFALFVARKLGEAGK
jgi:hypothetical protein